MQNVQVAKQPKPQNVQTTKCPKPLNIPTTKPNKKYSSYETSQVTKVPNY
jgi:hypothetical protein